MEYYYTNKKNILEQELFILDEEAHHLKNVLRKKTGDELFVTDGERNLYKVTVLKIEKEKIQCEIKERFYALNEPEKNIKLYMALLKNPSRFEFAIEKCAEIGVNEITPIITEHVINKELNKQVRWQSISLAAMKQSQRCYLPKINEPISFELAIKNCDSSFNLLADEGSKQFSLETFKNNNADISLFIGPEGGFSIEEVEFAEKNGFKIISLGKRKLRSETATIVGVNIMISHLI